jgi:hypothetical protein
MREAELAAKVASIPRSAIASAISSMRRAASRSLPRDFAT